MEPHWTGKRGMGHLAAAEPRELARVAALRPEEMDEPRAKPLTGMLIDRLTWDLKRYSCTVLRRTGDGQLCAQEQRALAHAGKTKVAGLAGA